MTLVRWTLMGIIGALTGIVAFLIDISVKYLFLLKYSLFERGKFQHCIFINNSSVSHGSHDEMDTLLGAAQLY